MSKERRRRISTAQLKMREMDIFVTGLDPTTPLGFDRFGISSIVKNGTGDYTINFASAFGRDDIMGWPCIVGTAAGMVTVSAINRSFISIRTFDPAGAASDRDFCLRILGSEFNYDV